MNKIQKAVKSRNWQKFRKSLKGLSTSTKLRKLSTWSRKGPTAKVQVENYKNALRRGGLLPKKRRSKR